MKDSKKIIMLDDELTFLEGTYERLNVIMQKLDAEYFALMDDYRKLHYFATAETEFNIVKDYVFWMGRGLEKSEECFGNGKEQTRESPANKCQ